VDTPIVVPEAQGKLTGKDVIWRRVSLTRRDPPRTIGFFSRRDAPMG